MHVLIGMGGCSFQPLRMFRIQLSVVFRHKVWFCRLQRNQGMWACLVFDSDIDISMKNRCRTFRCSNLQYWKFFYSEFSAVNEGQGVFRSSRLGFGPPPPPLEGRKVPPSLVCIASRAHKCGSGPRRWTCPTVDSATAVDCCGIPSILLRSFFLLQNQVPHVQVMPARYSHAQHGPLCEVDALLALGWA